MYSVLFVSVVPKYLILPRKSVEAARFLAQWTNVIKIP